jgi:hypothetical protein
VRVDVTARDVTDLGAFEFIMTFNGEVLEVGRNDQGGYRIEQGDFLGSSGREVFCGEPTIDTNALRYFCTTLGAEPRDGAEGEGLIASVFFETKGEGQSNLQFSHAQLTTPPGDRIDTEWQAGVIEIEDDGGMNWAFYAIVGGAVLAGILAVAAALTIISRRRSAAGSMAYPAEGE